MQVVVEVAGQSTETIELAEGDTVLVGREPSGARLAGVSEERVRTVAVTPPSVSANHLVMRRDGDTTSFVDANSRNGSWLRLPSGDRVEVRSSKPLHVQLAAPPAVVESSDGPKDATWIDRDDFHVGVIAAVSAWFTALGLAVRVTASPSDRPCRDDRASGRLPLANRHRLEVVPTRTADGSWNDTLASLWRYVNSQNAIFTSEEETRDEGMILASPAIRRAHRQVVTAAQRGFRLLLIGPSGSGKDGLARSYPLNLAESPNCSYRVPVVVHWITQSQTFEACVASLVLELGSEGTSAAQPASAADRTNTTAMVTRFMSQSPGEEFVACPTWTRPC